MMRSPLALLSAVLLTLASGVLSGCDALSGGPDYEEQVVVSAVLEVGRPLRPLTLTLTVPLGETTTPRPVDASVTLQLLDTSGAPEATYAYTALGSGRYASVATDVLVLPERTYRLTVEAEGRDLITAETTTPTAVEIVEAPENVIPYLQGFGPSFRVSSSSSDERQSVYLFQVRADAIDDYEVYEREDGSFGYRRLFVDGRFGPTPDAESFIDGIDCEPQGNGFDCDFEPSDFGSGSSPLLNEEAYIQNGDGTTTVTVPWLAVSFYGPHTFTLNTFDDALVDFVSTQSIQFNPTTLSPGEIPNITTNIRNGLGVFGSYASVVANATIVE